MALLEIRDLRVAIGKKNARRRALDGVNLVLERGRTLGIVGESGCGKSLTALSIMQLLPRPDVAVDGGQILYTRQEGAKPIDILSLHPNSSAMRGLRGEDIAMIFQEPMTSLDPVYPVGHQIAEMVLAHRKCSRSEAWERAVELLTLVGMPSPKERVHQYPHEFSGGMRQRVVIAVAMACDPALLIADEPTTALDVTVQAQVLDLVKNLQARFQSAVLFITHDIGVISQIADEVAVMYLGQVVERGPVRAVINRPAHPYTAGLINSVPTLQRPRGERIEPIPGLVPQIGSVTLGCRFRSRCPNAIAKCTEAPPMFRAGDNHDAACWLVEKEA